VKVSSVRNLILLPRLLRSYHKSASDINLPKGVICQ
jgi:hypothetical protein